jgi:hypothetical protein
VRGGQEEGGRRNRSLRLLVVTPGNWPEGLPEQSNVCYVEDSSICCS